MTTQSLLDRNKLKIVCYKTSDGCATASGRNKPEELKETLRVKPKVIHLEDKDMSLEGGVLLCGYLEGTLGWWSIHSQGYVESQQLNTS